MPGKQPASKEKKTAPKDRFGGKKAAAFGSGTKDRDGQDKTKTARTSKKGGREVMAGHGSPPPH